jgi:hypothetical protein
MQKVSTVRLAAFISALSVAACGGGGSGGGSNTTTSGESGAPAASAPGAASSTIPASSVVPASSVTPASAPVPASSAPNTSTGATLGAKIALADGTSLGVAQWADGSTTTGGAGQAVAGLACTVAGNAYTYAHLSIYQNGKLLSLPAKIGTVEPTLALQTGCVYPVHTDDSTGKIRMAANPVTPYTLGQFFAVWGQTLTNGNVAGLTSATVSTYVNDGGTDGATLTPYSGNLSDLALVPNREITIVLGSPLTQIPTYAWSDPPPFNPTPITLVYGGTVGNRFWPDGVTATGGTGQTVDGIICAPNMVETYHVHSHIAIYKDGQLLALPSHIGITSACDYETHTHDNTGIVHMETPTVKDFTLGKFFDLWGEPLTPTNVAGVQGTVVAYINDNGDVRRYMGALGDIELTSHRAITLQVGTAIPSLSTYSWYEPQ